MILEIQIAYTGAVSGSSFDEISLAVKNFGSLKPYISSWILSLNSPANYCGTQLLKGQIKKTWLNGRGGGGGFFEQWRKQNMLPGRWYGRIAASQEHLLDGRLAWKT